MHRSFLVMAQHKIPVLSLQGVERLYTLVHKLLQLKNTILTFCSPYQQNQLNLYKRKKTVIILWTCSGNLIEVSVDWWSLRMQSSRVSIERMHYYQWKFQRLQCCAKSCGRFFWSLLLADLSIMEYWWVVYQ